MYTFKKKLNHISLFYDINNPERNEQIPPQEWLDKAMKNADKNNSVVFKENLESTQISLKAELNNEALKKPYGPEALKNIIGQEAGGDANRFYATLPSEKLNDYIVWLNKLANQMEKNPSLYWLQPKQKQNTVQEPVIQQPEPTSLNQLSDAWVNQGPYSGMPKFEPIKRGGTAFNREWYDGITQEKVQQANVLLSEIERSSFANPNTKKKLKVLLTDLAIRNESIPNPHPNAPNAQRPVGVPISNDALSKLWLNLGQINSLRLNMSIKYPENGPALDPDKNKQKKVSAIKLLELS